jgi:predicted RNA methylase
VDVGCGKGRVLIVAAEYGFERVVGVEFSEELCEIARSNVTVYARKHGLSTNVEVVHRDAAEYEFRADDNVLFFFNPFDSAVMERVLENVRRSLERHPREITLLYYNAVGRQTIEAARMFDTPTEYWIGACHFFVFHRPRTHPK